MDRRELLRHATALAAGAAVIGFGKLQAQPQGEAGSTLRFWKERASKVTGKGLPGGHNLQEDVPDQVYTELRAFLRSS